MSSERGDHEWSPPTQALSPASAPGVAATATTLAIEQWIAIGAGVAAVIGAFMPWASIDTIFGGMSRSGIDDGGDGLLTAGLGVVGALAAWRLGKWLWVVALAGLAIAAIGIYDYSDVNSIVGDVNSEADGMAVASVGGGLYLTITAGVVMFAAGAAAWSKRRNAADDRGQLVIDSSLDGTVHRAHPSGGDASPSLRSDDRDITYDTSDWPVESLAAICANLEQRSVRYRLHGDDIIVEARHEALLDNLIAEVDTVRPDSKSPSEPPPELVAYSTATWSTSQLDLMLEHLANHGVTYTIEDGELVVGADDEALCDRLILDISNDLS